MNSSFLGICNQEMDGLQIYIGVCMYMYDYIGVCII